MFVEMDAYTSHVMEMYFRGARSRSGRWVLREPLFDRYSHYWSHGV